MTNDMKNQKLLNSFYKSKNHLPLAKTRTRTDDAYLRLLENKFHAINIDPIHLQNDYSSWNLFQYNRSSCKCANVHDEINKTVSDKSKSNKKLVRSKTTESRVAANVKLPKNSIENKAVKTQSCSMIYRYRSAPNKTSGKHAKNLKKFKSD
jgi:hypothetical protein